MSVKILQISYNFFDFSHKTLSRHKKIIINQKIQTAIS